MTRIKTEHHQTGAEGNRLEPNIWEQRYSIRSYEVDSRGNLSMASVFNFMQDAASNHAGQLGISLEQLLTEGRAWVLSRLLIKIDAYPRWKDDIRIFTWPSGIQGLFALRDFELKDTSDRSLGAGLTAWLIIDSRKRRPVRMHPYADRLNPMEGVHVLEDKLEKLPRIQAADTEQGFRVGYRDLDLNQHVNSVRYIEWALESIPQTVMDTRILSILEITFMAEAFLGDRVLATGQSIEGLGEGLGEGMGLAFYHNILRETDGQELARLRTVWRSE
jgi:acyl-ACP thioesterase